MFKLWFRKFENIKKKLVFNGRRGMKVKGGYAKSYKVRLGWAGTKHHRAMAHRIKGF